jgi:hypothetical protein
MKRLSLQVDGCPSFSVPPTLLQMFDEAANLLTSQMYLTYNIQHMTTYIIYNIYGDLYGYEYLSVQMSLKVIWFCCYQFHRVSSLLT